MFIREKQGVNKFNPNAAFLPSSIVPRGMCPLQEEAPGARSTPARAQVPMRWWARQGADVCTSQRRTPSFALGSPLE